MRIAMWSGPRNLSTAMMYSFAARGDFAVVDEPFYGAYLENSGASHPMRNQVLATTQTDPARVAAELVGPIPDGKPHYYQKHMPHHMLPGFPLDWAAECVNVHLIRHPARVVASYGAKRTTIELTDIGYPQQVEILRKVGGAVIDSADIRRDSREALAVLCEHIGIEFTPRMLRWPQGPKPFDGIWAAHWYDAVHRSQGFAGPEGPLPKLDGEAALLVEAAMPYYEEMAQQRLL